MTSFYNMCSALSFEQIDLVSKRKSAHRAMIGGPLYEIWGDIMSRPLSAL